MSWGQAHKQDLEQTITVEQVTALIGISRRQLDRLIQQKLGVYNMCTGD
ncbi:hypothetical protein ACBZ91_04455 [Vibrio natriegens]